MTSPSFVVAGTPRFWVVSMTTRYDSFADVQREASEALAAHVRRSWELHHSGRLLMAGAFLDEPGSPVRTMGILRTEADAREFAEHDPFVLAGMVADWSVRPWANIFASPHSPVVTGGRGAAAPQ